MLQYNNVFPLFSLINISEHLLHLFGRMHSLLEMQLLEDLRTIPSIDGLDGLLHPVLHVELEGSQGELDVGDLVEPEVDEVLVIRPLHLLLVVGRLLLHDVPELAAEGLQLLRRQQELGMGQDDEVERS